MNEGSPPGGRPGYASRAERAVLVFFGGALLAVGWLGLVLGGLCTLATGFFSVVGVGDSSRHTSPEDWVPATVMLGFGAGCFWAGRQMHRAARSRDGRDDRSDA